MLVCSLVLLSPFVSSLPPGIINTIGRLISGALAGVPNVNSLLLNNVSMVIAGLAIFLTPFCNSYATLVLAAGVFGLFTGIEKTH